MVPNWRKYMALVVLLCVSIHISAQVAFQCKGQYYASLSPSLHGPSNLYEVKIDPASNLAIFDPIKINVGKNVNAIGYRSVDNLIYGVDPDEFFLYKLDSNGDIFFLKQLPLTNGLEYFAGDISPDGRFLILIGGGGFTGLDSEIVKVDLNSPNFDITRVNVQANTRIFDIAFDPEDGTLFGLDSNAKRLVKINPNTGNMDISFPQQPTVNSIGALFFDTFGNLFAYGGLVNEANQDKLFEINKSNGSVAVLTNGPIAQGNDGCSCPYTIKLEKTVLPKETFPCELVEYTFTIANNSGSARQGINLIDVLPGGFDFVDVIRNPYGGDSSLSGGSLVSITGLNVFPGKDSIIISVYIDDIQGGIYKNQAQLVNLPLELGSYTQSDNPATFIKEDSTDIKVLDLSLEFIAEEYLKCEGENLILDATIPGAIILWNGEETDPVKIITGPGTYTLEARNNCEIIIKTITVTEEYVNVSTFQTEYDVMLGEYLDFNIDIVTNSNTSSILWNDPNGNSSFSCIDCEEPNLRPLFDAIYSATVTSEAGCIDIVDINVHVDKQRDIFAPNIFSPNGDGSNDIFYLTGTEFVTVNEFNIFDRWGNLVYSTISKELGESNEGWSGDYNGYPVNPGVYVWYAEVEWLDGHIENIAGDVTVLR